ncbi:hypothetical protein [Niveibacterium umoris]|uniref:Thioesterase n=1 Tax=Niveibacterium umoris TaxID=1193620 RepID=A0A840BKG7_9RHOO|nr:hypothetical protein [Niveibacterium umoris]MBB4013755.1 hypothetical protein [Niveibacterium umoris]
MSQAFSGEAAWLLDQVESALGALRAAVAPDCLRLGDAQIQIERSLPRGGDVEHHWTISESGRAGLRVAAYLAERNDPRPAVRISLTYVISDPLSGKPSLLDAERLARLNSLRA